MPGEKASDDIRNISIYVLINVFEKRSEKNEKIYKVLGTFNTQRFKEFAKNPHLINDDNLKYVAQKSNAESGIALKECFNLYHFLIRLLTKLPLKVTQNLKVLTIVQQNLVMISKRLLVSLEKK